MMLSKLVIAVVSPLGTALVLGVLAWLSGLFGKRRLALVLGGMALVWLWVWSLPVPSNWLRG
ncbi:YdcF family protein, partial [bacterium]|nr:YdcF family protein [bacterium]